MTDTVRWGVLGTGRIAGIWADALPGSRSGKLTAVGSRAAESAQAFADRFGITRAHASYDALLADPDVQAVYITTPHPLHARWAIRAAEAGKHILCEKPLTMNHPEATAVFEAARRAGVFCMEAFMYRCHPQTARIIELLRDGAIGEVRLIEASFAFRAPFDPSGRLFDPGLGGGAILDVGCYCVSMARLLAGAATGADHAEPEEVNGSAHIGQTGVDEYAVATLRFPGGILATLKTGVRLQDAPHVRVVGEEGILEVPHPWLHGRGSQPTSLLLHRRGNDPQTIHVDADRSAFAYEIDVVGSALADGRLEAEPPAPTWPDTLGTMMTLDRWRSAIGLTHPADGPEAHGLPLTRLPLRSRPVEADLPTARIEGIDKDVSRLVLGVTNQRTFPHAAVLFDDFFERGGNCFDTGWVYMQGEPERMLGWWVNTRGVRDDVVIVAKGAHSPWCTPEHVTAHLIESLERLQTDHVDLFLLHRDNPDIGVDEFVDVLNQHIRSGDTRAVGVSNWTMERVDEANSYADANGLVGLRAISNNFSLARMAEPLWPGCISASDPAWRSWLSRTRIPLLAWSSQAHGFFTPLGDPENRSNPRLVRGFHTKENFERRNRAGELAHRLGVAPTAVALAYVLSQPFPTFALIGPQSIEETRTSLEGATLELSANQLTWLDAGTERDA